MRILHTADWHLCDHLGWIDRGPDLRARVEIVAGLCDEHQVDTLVIAGDLFSERASPQEMADALTHLHDTFADFFARGGAILAVTGNHDEDKHVELVRHSMRLASPHASRRQLQGGRMYLLNRPYFGVFESKAGDRAQFVLIPYPTSSRYAEQEDVFRSKEEENRVLQGRVAEHLQRFKTDADFDEGLPTVLAAHLHVRGSAVHSLYKLSERDDVVFDAGFLPSTWAYIALGHIHKPQSLSGMNHVRYPGSLDRLHFDERADEKGVVLIDLGPSGLRSEPSWLPIPATPLHEIAITDAPAELPTLAERYPDRHAAIVKVRITHNSAGPSRAELQRELNGLFPRLKEIVWVKPDETESAASVSFKPHSDYRTTIRSYIAKELTKYPDDKDAVMALAETFLVEEGTP